MKDCEINEAIAQLNIGKLSCCRCSCLGDLIPATLIRYGAPFCSEDCAERASDYSLEAGQEDIPDYVNDNTVINGLISGLDDEALAKFVKCLADVLAVEEKDLTFLACGKLMTTTTKQKAIAYLKMMGRFDE